MSSTRKYRRMFGALARAMPLLGSAACSGACPTVQECDIRDSSCQQKTSEVAVCLRGGKTEAPPVVVVQAGAFVESQVDDLANNPESPYARDLRVGLALFGLASGGADQSQTLRDYWNNVAAFFDSKTGKVTVLDRGGSLDGPGAVTLLLHELIHAMQHRDHGSDYYDQHTTTYDDELALAGMTEGEATLYQDLATAYGYDRQPEDVGWDGIFHGYEAQRWGDARKDDSPYEMAWLRFPYAFGGAFLNRAWRTGGNDAVRAAVARPPASTRQVLGGYGSTPNGDAWRENPDEVGNPVMSADFEKVATRHLGSWMFAVFKDVWTGVLTALDDHDDTGFAGDVFTVFRTPATSDVTSVWRVRFETTEHTDAFISALAEPRTFSVSRVDRDVVMVSSTDGTTAASIIQTLTWTAAPEADSTDPTSTASASALPWACALP